MTTTHETVQDAEREPWTAMIAIALGQMIMSYNVASLPVALGPMVESFGVGPTTVATGIVAYSMIVAVFGLSQVMMTLSVNATMMISAQALCGAGAAVIVPALVALIAENYRGAQQATAVGMLGSARAAAGVIAFLVGGVLGTTIGWRPAFAVLIAVSVVVLLLSTRLKRVPGRPEVGIDWLGVLLAASGIILIAFGFNNLNAWGIGLARATAPFSVLGMSPAPIMIVVGLFLGQTFLSWTRRHTAAGGTPLLPLQLLDSASERAAVYAMFSVVALEAALNFTVPLYIQIVQGRSPLDTTIAMLPFNLTVFFSALLIVRFYDRFSPRQIGRFGFAICTLALLWLTVVVRNDWSSVPVLLGLVAFGIGQGALVTLVFNVLVTAAPKEQAGDVGSLRGTTQNLAAAVGTAVAGALLVTLLSTAVMRQLATNPVLTQELQAQVNLDSITFVSNDHLAEVILATDATDEQKAEALRVNTEARLWALKIGLLVMAGLSLLTIVPAGRLPNYRPGEIPVQT